MRIAVILLRPAVGGAETLVAGLERLWRADGHDVTVLYLDPPDAAPGRLARLRRLTRALRDVDPDVIHAHSALPCVYARMAARGRWPTVTVLHSAERSFDRPSLRWAERALRRWTAHVVAVSHGQVAEYRERFGAATPLTLVPNGVRDDLPVRGVASSRLARAAALCRLAPQKRIDVLTAGWARAALPGVELVIAGSAPDRETAQQVDGWIAASPGARAVGDVTDVPAFLGDTDLLVHAADSEAHPLSPIEAAVCGVPVVVSDRVAPAVPELPAVVFRAGDADDLAAVLGRVARDYDQVARTAIDAAPALRERFSLRTCADRHLDVIRGVTTRLTSDA